MPLAFCAIGIMAKTPQVGASKTRLVPPLTPAEAADLSSAFIRDIAANIAAAAERESVAGYAAYTPAGSEAALRALLPADFGLVPPRSLSFGAHLHDAAADLLALGHRAACLVNSDSPNLPTALLLEAVGELSKPGERVVLGPAADGGYYLIGLTRARRELFADIDWGSARVFDQTLERAASLRLPVHRLPEWYDVDDVATLRRLADDLNRNAPGFVAPHSRAVLRGFLDGGGRDRLEHWSR